MKRSGIIAGIFLVVCLVFTCVQAHAAGIPQLINYQGYLTDKDGNPLETKEYTLSFSIYDAASFGTEVWGPQTFNNVPVVKGYFNVILGPNDSHKPSPRPISNAFTSEKAYLSIAVNNGSPLTPRQQILSAPYAFEAVNAINAIHGVPVGTVVAFYGNTAPEGWLLCNGQEIPNEDKYKKLKELVGNNTPNLKGRTIVGAGQGEGLTTRNLRDTGGEENHTLNTNEMPSHLHDYDDIVYLENKKPEDGFTYFHDLIGSHSTDFDNESWQWAHPTGSTGGGQAHNNMQPFYVLSYIIKY